MECDFPPPCRSTDACFSNDQQPHANDPVCCCCCLFICCLLICYSLIVVLFFGLVCLYVFGFVCLVGCLGVVGVGEGCGSVGFLV